MGDSAEVWAHCDNSLTVKQRNRGGIWKTVGTETSWSSPFHYVVIPVSQLTELRFECVDKGYIGGFIATVNYGGVMYSTVEPMSQSMFSIVEGDTTTLKYHEKTAGPWKRHTEGIASNAKWIWNGQTNNAMTFEFSFDGLEVPEQCYYLEGNAAIVWGDPHTTTFAGVKHDYQGLPQNGLDQFYYIHQCAGYDKTDLPYTMIGRHFPYRGSTKVSGLDYMVLELFDYDGTEYVAFFSSAIHEFGQSENTDYDTVEGLSAFSSGVTTTIGTRFSIHYLQKDSKQIHVTLTVDNHCRLSFTMIGQYDYNSDLGRYTMHYVRVNPPECYKCAVCGLLGDFKGRTMQTCDGQSTVNYGGYTNAWDPRGWTWEKTYTDNHCDVDTPSPPPTDEPYTPPSDPEFPYDPCTDTESELRKAAQQKCDDAMKREDLGECCTTIGQSFCDGLMDNCAFDSCFTSGEDMGKLSDQVTEVLVNPILAECDNLVIDEEDYEEFATRNPTTKPTAEPTSSTTTTEAPFTCCKDQTSEQDCANNYLTGKRCTWLPSDAPLAIKFATQCLGESLVLYGPAPSEPGFEGDNPITDYCHPVEAETRHNRDRMAVKVTGLSSKHVPQIQVLQFLAVAVIVLALGGLSLLCRTPKNERYEPVADPMLNTV